MTKKVILVWFRNDLRIHDNEILHEAVQKGDIIIPVYFFDPRYFKLNDIGFQNTGILRTLFLIDAVTQFKSTLQKIGADLDRKSTRLNSSHVKISYAVFCLKKKT